MHKGGLLLILKTTWSFPRLEKVHRVIGIKGVYFLFLKKVWLTYRFPGKHWDLAFTRRLWSHSQLHEVEYYWSKYLLPSCYCAQWKTEPTKIDLSLVPSKFSDNFKNVLCIFFRCNLYRIFQGNEFPVLENGRDKKIWDRRKTQNVVIALKGNFKQCLLQKWWFCSHIPLKKPQTFIFTINSLSLKWTFFKAEVVDFTGCDHDWEQTNTLHKITS